MDDLPSLELLEMTHKFPCKYTVKVIGQTDNAFVDRVVTAAREGLKWDFDPPCRIRETSGGRHVSVTLEPNVESAEQVLDLYSSLKQVEGIVLLL